MPTTELKTEMKRGTMIAFDRAAALVRDTVHPLPTEIIPLSEARGRVLAEDVRADEDAVPYARSAMDGYAVRAVEVQAFGWDPWQAKKQC